MSGFNVQIEQICTHSEHSYEKYGSWEESYSNYFKKVTLSNTDYPDVLGYKHLTYGDRAFVVWVEYSQGDSFGNGHNSGVQAIAVLDSEEEALALKKAIEDHYNDETKRHEYSFPFILTDGTEISVYAGSWTGYFETLEHIYIEDVAISYT